MGIVVQKFKVMNGNDSSEAKTNGAEAKEAKATLYTSRALCHWQRQVEVHPLWGYS